MCCVCDPSSVGDKTGWGLGVGGFHWDLTAASLAPGSEKDPCSRNKTSSIEQDI